MARRKKPEDPEKRRARRHDTLVGLAAVLGVLVVLGVPIGVVLFTPYLGEGLYWLMPTTRRQLVAGLAVAGVLLALTVWSALERRGTHRLRPAWHQVAFAAIGIFAFCVAPLHRNVGSHQPTSADRYAGTFVTVLYISYVVIGLAFWLTRRLARRRLAAAAAAGTPSAGSAAAPTASSAAADGSRLPSPVTVPGSSRGGFRFVVAGVVPLAAVAAIMTLGAKHPAPTPEEAAAAAREAPPPVHWVQVPALAGTTLSEQMAVSELTGHGAAIVPTLLAHDLTGVDVDGVWESAAEARDDDGQFDVYVTVDALVPGFDRAKATATLEAARTQDPLPAGWVDATADTTEPAAARLVGDRLLVVRAHEAGPAADKRLRAVLPQLTDARLAAVSAAVTAAG